MIYKLLHKLFGWDYIYWTNICDQGIARVYVSPSGVVYYYRYRLTGLIDHIHKYEQVLWLTCLPSKYFPLI